VIAGPRKRIARVEGVDPGQLYLPPTYHRAHFDQRKRRHRIEQLIGDSDGALPVPQDIRVSRLIIDAGESQTYKPRSMSHGVYVFVLEGEMRCGETATAHFAATVRVQDVIHDSAECTTQAFATQSADAFRSRPTFHAMVPTPS
jgi:hypothetical protein